MMTEDEINRRIASHLAKASRDDRLIFNACLTAGAHRKYQQPEPEPEPEPRRWRWGVRLPPIIIGQLLTLAVLFAWQPEVTLRSTAVGVVTGAAYELGKHILKG